jgi:hypothetical protein
MPITQIRRVALAGAFAGLCLAVGPTPAGASTRTPQQAEFYRAVVTCEQRTAPTALRACVHELATPDPSEPAIFDLWDIFNDCLAYADKAMLDTMYPPTDEDFEDAVNGCLGL